MTNFKNFVTNLRFLIFKDERVEGKSVKKDNSQRDNWQSNIQFIRKAESSRSTQLGKWIKWKRPDVEGNGHDN